MDKGARTLNFFGALVALHKNLFLKRQTSVCSTITIRDIMAPILAM